jgi:protein ImuB
MRTIAVWCPDWPVTAARIDAEAPYESPIAVFTGSRVVACNHIARSAGIRRRQRRREAQALCPSLVVLPRNDAAEARYFEPVVRTLESVAPGVELTRPGLAAIAARGPARYFGGEDGVLRSLSLALADFRWTRKEVPIETALAETSPAEHAPAEMDVLIGIADGAFAAEQAARRGMVVPPGQSGEFVAGLPVSTLDDPELADLLYHLGLRTLGDFAGLSAKDVFARFGPAGAWAHLQAGGVDDRPVAARRPPPDSEVAIDFEPPLDRVDAVAFSARTSAEDFIGGLAARGLACTRLEIQVSTDCEVELSRRWRHTGVLGSHDVLDRIRWQLSSLVEPRSQIARRNHGAVTRLRIIPLEVVPTGAHQQTLWGGSGDADERASRAFAHVQTMLGHGSVLRPVRVGGRDPLSRTELIAWGEEPTPMHSPQQPWPGSIPAPAPTVLLDPPRPVRVLDATGQTVVVTERGGVPRPPAGISVKGGEPPVAVTAWAGPWPVDERWWSAESASRVVRCQIVDARGRAYLVSAAIPAHDETSTGDASACTWNLEALYD